MKILHSISFINSSIGSRTNYLVYDKNVVSFVNAIETVVVFIPING